MKDIETEDSMGVNPYELENPYAPPQSGWDGAAVQGESGLTVEGNIIISPNDHVWPDRCVVCNAPANGFKLKRTMYWHHPAIYLLFLISWLIYVIVALIVRKKGTIHIGLCSKHRARRRNGIIIGWLGAVGSLITVVVGAGAGGHAMPYMMSLGILGIVGFMAIGIAMAQTVRPKKIDNTKLWLIVKEPFRRSL